MPVVNLKVNIEGLKELISSVSPDKLTKQITTGIRDIANDLNKELVSAVKQRYAINKGLNSVLIGNGASITLSGNNIQATLAYEYKYVDLSQFPYSPHTVPAGFARHYSTVIRGKSKNLHDNERGGFVPRKRPTHRTSPNKEWLARNGKTRMFERIGKDRLPLRVLYGPSLSQMARVVLQDHPTEGISNIVDNLDTLISNKLEL